MSLTYPVNADSKWSIIQVSTGDIISRGQPWPRVDLGEIQGSDPDFVYLEEKTATKPDYDARLFTLQGTETVDGDANEIRKTWKANKREAADQKLSIVNVESERIRDIISPERELIETRLIVTALLSYVVDNQDFPPVVRAMVDEYKRTGVKIWKNRATLSAKIKDIDEGKDIAIDAGWESA